MGNDQHAQDPIVWCLKMEAAALTGEEAYNYHPLANIYKSREARVVPYSQRLGSEDSQ